MKTIIKTVKKEITTEKSTAVLAREKEARMQVLSQRGVTDMRNIDSVRECEIFHEVAIEETGDQYKDLFAVASGIAFKKMRFKFNQGYSSFSVSNMSLHDELADVALFGMIEYVNAIAGTVDSVTLSTVFTDEPQQVIRAGYSAMDRLTNQVARNERKHLYADVSENPNVLELQDVTAVIEHNYIDSDLQELFTLCCQNMTPPQKAVFKYLLKGYTDETIAQRLKCSRVNVTKIRHTVRKKLQTVREYLHE